MLKLNLFLLLTVLTYNVCYSYKLLVVFPIPGKSHGILGDGYIRTLLKAGHEVTYITAVPVQNSDPKLRQIDVSSNINVLISSGDLFSITSLLEGKGISDPGEILQIMQALTNATVIHENVHKLMNDPKERFDAVIAEWMFSEVYAGFAAIFNCPLIWSSSMEPHHMVLSLIDETPNPSYIADTFASELPPFSFWLRINQLWALIMMKYKKWSLDDPDSDIYNSAFSSVATKRGIVLPSLGVAKYNASLMLGNSHVSSGQALRLPQNYIPIAGYHIEENTKPLPQDLAKIMDNAKDGVIYFSMGTMLRISTLPEKLRNGFMEMFRGLKQTVIWKSDLLLENLPKNVHMLEWVPQASILAHPNCVLFITHGGLLSTTETLHYGVPIIGMPMYADQFNNVNRAQNKGFAKRVTLGDDAPVNLKAAIEEMVSNPRYRERVAELSLIYHDRPVSSTAELTHWVEHVVRTRGAMHLRSPALALPWYQKYYLDLMAIVLVAIVIIKKTICRSFKTKSVQKKKRN